RADRATDVLRAGAEALAETAFERAVLSFDAVPETNVVFGEVGLGGVDVEWADVVGTLAANDVDRAGVNAAVVHVASLELPGHVADVAEDARAARLVLEVEALLGPLVATDVGGADPDLGEAVTLIGRERVVDELGPEAGATMVFVDRERRVIDLSPGLVGAVE